MKNILIIGIGRLGYHIARELNKFNAQILAIDINESRLQTVDQYVSKTIIGDSSDLDFLRTIGVNTFDECIVTISDNFQASIETVMNLKELGARKITARASKESQNSLLMKIGADLVIYPERQLAKWVALHCGTDSIYDYMELDNNYGIFEVNIPKEWNEKSLAELDLRKKYEINIIGIKNKNGIRIITGPNHILKENEKVIILAKEDNISKVLGK